MLLYECLITMFVAKIEVWNDKQEKRLFSGCPSCRLVVSVLWKMLCEQSINLYLVSSFFAQVDLYKYFGVHMACAHPQRDSKGDLYIVGTSNTSLFSINFQLPPQKWMPVVLCGIWGVNMDVFIGWMNIYILSLFSLSNYGI